MEKFFSDDELDELYGILDELEEEEHVIVEGGDIEELSASERRYLEIIKKHKIE